MLIASKTPLIRAEEIRSRIAELALEIKTAYPSGESLTVIGLLRGCYVFMADLLRELSCLDIHVKEVDFIIVSSYGSSTESSGNVKIERDIRQDIHDCHVLLVDDILDTGITMQKLINLLNLRKPASLRSCVLLEKPERRLVDIRVDFIGFKIPDQFVVGMGLDYNQQYRELPYITTIIKSEDTVK